MTERTRAAAIIIKDDQILLMHRRKNGFEYWIFPGGGIEDGETGPQAAIREVQEETGLVCQSARLAFEVETREGGKLHPFYLCEGCEGEVCLGGEEAKIQSPDNWYDPKWVSIAWIISRKINLLPESARNCLLDLLDKKEIP